VAQWEKRTLELPPDHGWRCKPGHRIFVANRGAVAFDYPAEWAVEPGPDSIRFTDRKPPDDNCLLQLSVIMLPKGIDWTGLSLGYLLRTWVRQESGTCTIRGEIVTVRRPDLELAWVEDRRMDPREHREACSRACLARGNDVQAFLTIDYWPEDAERAVSVWDEVLRTLQLGVYVQNPTRRRPN
jgi:hypothetical protein